MKKFLFYLIILVLVSCNVVFAAPNEDGMTKRNQVATFNVSVLSAQVIATVEEEKKEIKQDLTAPEDITKTHAYRLFTLQSNATKYIELTKYDGSLLDALSIDVDTTCYFCLPESTEISFS